MKIKEKGLTGKNAKLRKDVMKGTRGFNAFREMAQNKASSSAPGEKQPKKDVYLDFMGTKILIHQDDKGNGSIKEDDVPFVKGATLKFDGCGGDVTWSEIKVCVQVPRWWTLLIPPAQDPIKEKFEGRSPFIKYSRGDDHGLVGFHKVLSEDEIALVKETIKTINSKPVTWSLPEGQ